MQYVSTKNYIVLIQIRLIYAILLADDIETNLMSELLKGREEVLKTQSLMHVTPSWTVTRNYAYCPRSVFVLYEGQNILLFFVWIVLCF